jgi:transposase
MKLYGGIDLHSNNNVFNLVDENANVVLKKRISNDIEAIILLLQPYSDAI